MKETKDVSVIQKTRALSPLVERTLELTIESDRDMKEANEILSKMNQIMDAAEAEEVKITRPALDIIAVERKRWKPLKEMFSPAIDMLRNKMKVFHNEQKRLASEEEAKLADRIGDGKGKLKVETAIRKMGEIERPEAVISGNAGDTKFRTVPRFEVMDIKKVPVEFLLVDEVLVRKAQKEGRDIAGIRYYTEDIPMNFR